jgi:hypothetical protein
MPTADWTGFALTALGGVLAAGGGWVNGLAQSKRERGKEDRSIRRVAYIEFLYRSGSLLEAMGVAGRELRLASHDGALASGAAAAKLEIDRAYIELRRAENLIVLSAPTQIKLMAKDRSTKLHDLLHVVDDMIVNPAADTDARLGEFDRLSEQLHDEDDAGLLAELMKKNLLR